MKPNIIIGCMTWGKWGKQLSQKEQTELLEFCIEQGNTTFDHADIYGDYTAEAEFGLAFANSSIKRGDIKLTSKCGIQLIGESRPNKVKHYNYSKDYIIWSAENSLKHLKTDYLDTFLLHRPSPLMQAEEVAEAANILLNSGKIKQFGVSNFAPSQIELLSKWLSISINQIEFSLTHTQAMYDGTLDQAQSIDIAVQAWSPMGIVFKEINSRTTQINTILSQLAEKYNAKANTLLLSWILKHPAKISPVIGSTDKQRIMDANKALTIDLELEDWFEILQVSNDCKMP